MSGLHHGVCVPAVLKGGPRGCQFAVGSGGANSGTVQGGGPGAIDEDRNPGVNGSEALKAQRLTDALLESGAIVRPVPGDP
jgi:hypothetical protein